MNHLDQMPLEIACPGCRQRIAKTVRWFKQNGNCCPGCGLLLPETAEFRRGINAAEQEIAKFKRMLD